MLMNTPLKRVEDIPPLLRERLTKAEESGWKILDLSGCKETLDVTALTEVGMLEQLSLEGCTNLRRGLREICNGERTRNLRTLHLSNLPMLDDTCIKILGGTHLRLELFTCAHCKNVTNVRPLAEIKALKSLSLGHCVNIKHGLKEICGGLTNMRALWINHIPAVDDACIAELGAKGDGYEGHLIWLICDGCLGITDVTAISEIKTLKRLSLTGCENITKGLEEMCASEKLQDLQDLWVNNVKAFSDKCLLNLEESHRKGGWKLQVLSTKDCCSITDVSPLGKLVTLRVLCLDGCVNIKQGLDHVILSLVDLREAYLGGIGITDRHIELLGRHKKIERLHLPFSGNITDITPLTNVWTLEALCLCGCLKATRGFEKFSTLFRLKKLCVCGVYVDADTVMALKGKGVAVKLW
ncbi:leucine-rich repeat protein (LRRP), putative [Trypanosoma brucei brucei TREU927]|uniref:Leucine-rich repeat protein (LRRP), putative n=1 Tax=Trypanosoma brucei brucei (strain 927/4 GUTat10.1) TaxID=185431 RepID=Q386A4_TRYB2|nr:uncharacterized protein Tb11.02.1580 [Trypanosoma brucei brucei TREU927]EAN79377.1 leucine-rich repeat protein (LRRP), putative [Trypanosoma brucei brucei TREU927]